MGKYGLSGNSGFVTKDLHIAAPYDSNGMVFVEQFDGEFGMTWERVKIEEAISANIIRCYLCDKPAVSLDHYWPYHSELCRCEDHYGKKE